MNAESIYAMSHPKIFPVIHHIDRLTTLSEVGIARSCGVDGVFLIAHGGEDEELLGVAWEAKQMNKLFPIGVNLLSKPADLAVILVCQWDLDMVWADSMGVDSSGLTAMGERIQVVAGLYPQVLFFASVAFKYQAAELQPVLAAQKARTAGFIPTTSGERTGSAPDLTKIIFMSENSKQTLAVASGMTPENVADFAPHLSHILVSTGVSKDEHHLDPARLSAFVDVIRGQNSLQTFDFSFN